MTGVEAGVLMGAINQDDPVIMAAKWIALLMLLVLMGAAPMMNLARRFRADRASNAIDEAAKTLYEQLNDHLRKLESEVKSLRDENESLRKLVKSYEQDIDRFRVIVDECESHKKRANNLQELVLVKDTRIRELEERNTQLERRVEALSARIQTLEERITVDEERMRRHVTLTDGEHETGGRADG